MHSPFRLNFSFRTQLSLCALFVLSFAPLQAQDRESIGSMSLESLTTAIKGQETGTVLPYMLELVRRIEAEPDPRLDPLLAQCYSLLARFHYNQFVELRQQPDRKQCFDFAQRLLERYPINI